MADVEQNMIPDMRIMVRIDLPFIMSVLFMYNYKPLETPGLTDPDLPYPVY
jgi:hypothetical protein